MREPFSSVPPEAGTRLVCPLWSWREEKSLAPAWLALKHTKPSPLTFSLVITEFVTNID